MTGTDIRVSGGGGPAAVQDPYGLLTTPAGWEWGDEFDDGVIDAAWVQVAPSAGSVTWAEGNHRLGALVTAVPDVGAGAIIRPIGTAWGTAGEIVETQLMSGPRTGLIRCGFLVADGAVAGSNSVGVLMDSVSDVRASFVVRGTVASPYATAFTALGLGGTGDQMRCRIVAKTADLIAFQFSYDGVSWQEAATTFSITTLGWTPTHVGFSFCCQSNGENWGGTADYVRRFGP